MERKTDTHIRVTEETWSRLNKRKKPGDSFDDVISRVLDEADAESSDDDESSGKDSEGDGANASSADAVNSTACSD